MVVNDQRNSCRNQCLQPQRLIAHLYAKSALFSVLPMRSFSLAVGFIHHVDTVHMSACSSDDILRAPDYRRKVLFGKSWAWRDKRQFGHVQTLFTFQTLFTKAEDIKFFGLSCPNNLLIVTDQSSRTIVTFGEREKLQRRTSVMINLFLLFFPPAHSLSIIMSWKLFGISKVSAGTSLDYHWPLFKRQERKVVKSKIKCFIFKRYFTLILRTFYLGYFSMLNSKHIEILVCSLNFSSLLLQRWLGHREFGK